MVEFLELVSIVVLDKLAEMFKRKLMRLTIVMNKQALWVIRLKGLTYSSVV